MAGFFQKEILEDLTLFDKGAVCSRSKLLKKFVASLPRLSFSLKPSKAFFSVSDIGHHGSSELI